MSTKEKRKKINRKRKGTNAERELLHLLWEKGYAVVRASSSGAIKLPCPDIVAIKSKRILAFEIKNWEKKPSVNRKQFYELYVWAERAGAIPFLAWKAPRKGFIFYSLERILLYNEFSPISLEEIVE
jgi:Holliday junction resolvase